MSFQAFLEERGVTEFRLTKSGRVDRRNKKLAKLEEEWFNLTIKGEPTTTVKQESCPVCYEDLGSARVTTACGHKFCISCFTRSVRESDKCALCRAPLSDAEPKKTEPMDVQVAHQLLKNTVLDLGNPLLKNMYDTIYHDIGDMEEKIEEMHKAKDTPEKCQTFREKSEYQIMHTISERFMVFGYNVLHRANLWHTEESSFPGDPRHIVYDLENRQDAEHRLARR